MDFPAAGAGPNQVMVQGAQARLAQLAVGQLYRVQVTDVLPGKAEVLLGNQYLLASTNLRFSPGDVINLKLVQQNPELLIFQLALPSATGGGQQQFASDLATMLRAANLPPTQENATALSTLLRGGVPVSNQTVGDMVQLTATYPPEVVSAFLPLYKELIERGLRVSNPVLQQLVMLQQGTPELGGLLAGMLQKLRTQRRGGTSKSKLDDAVEAALTRVDSEDDLPTAALLKQKLRLLYGSPERGLRDLLLQAHREAAERDAAEEGSTPAASSEAASQSGSYELELADLTNIAIGQPASPEAVELIELLQALRVHSAMGKDTRALLPLELDGEPATAMLTLTVLAEQYYQKDYTLRVRVRNETQGIVEFQLRTRGPGLFVDILAEEPQVAEAYRTEVERLRSELTESGFVTRRIEVGVQAL